MSLRVAINGFGRIGRNLVRAYCQRAASRSRIGKGGPGFEIVAVNDLGSAESLLHLLRYDTTHGPFQGEAILVEVGTERFLQVNGRSIAVSQCAEPDACPWAAHDVDIVVECTGVFRAREDAARHIVAGARQVIIGAVSFDDVESTLVYGVNHQDYRPEHAVISAASCTTHCIAPLLSLLDENWGVESALMTEIHAYTSDQSLLDRVHRDLRRGRAGAQNLIPTTSSSIAAVQRVLPQLVDKIDGYSMRVPTLNVAAVDLTLMLRDEVDSEALNACFLEASGADSWRGIVGYCDEPLVSVDFVQRPESAIFDATQLKHVGPMHKITAWYDNEWGYSHRMLDLLEYIASQR